MRQPTATFFRQTAKRKAHSVLLPGALLSLVWFLFVSETAYFYIVNCVLTHVDDSAFHEPPLFTNTKVHKALSAAGLPPTKNVNVAGTMISVRSFDTSQ